jgi:hypothetical protein
MIRKFKVVGALMAVMALSAVMASGAQATFTASSYPATVTATSTADVFDAFGSNVKCTNNSFTGSLAGASTELTITPTYLNCKGPLGLPATVETTDCHFLFTAPTTPAPSPATGQLHIKCPVGVVGIHIRVYSDEAHKTEVCHDTIPPQTLTYTVQRNAGDVSLIGEVANITATQVRKSFLCPEGEHTASARYTIQAGGITVSSAGKTVTYD